MLADFKDFLMKGNLVTLAVAFVIGVAFAAVVSVLRREHRHADHRGHRRAARLLGPRLHGQRQRLPLRALPERPDRVHRRRGDPLLPGGAALQPAERALREGRPQHEGLPRVPEHHPGRRDPVRLLHRHRLRPVGSRRAGEARSPAVPAGTAATGRCSRRAWWRCGWKTSASSGVRSASPDGGAGRRPQALVRGEPRRRGHQLLHPPVAGRDPPLGQPALLQPVGEGRRVGGVAVHLLGEIAQAGRVVRVRRISVIAWGGVSPSVPAAASQLARMAMKTPTMRPQASSTRPPGAWGRVAHRGHGNRPSRSLDSCRR